LSCPSTRTPRLPLMLAAGCLACLGVLLMLCGCNTSSPGACGDMRYRLWQESESMQEYNRLLAIHNLESEEIERERDIRQRLYEQQKSSCYH